MILIANLIFDTINVEHITRHKVVPEEVEQACHNKPLVERLDNGRLFVTGPTDSDRMLVVVLTPKVGGAFYPVTARSADKRERRIYEQKMGGDDE